MNRCGFCLCVCLAAGALYASPHVPGEVLVSVPDDYLVPPPGRASFSPDDGHTDAALMAILQKYRVSEIRKVFPTFRASNTSYVSKDGIVVRLPDLSRVYKLVCPAATEVESVVVDLETSGRVTYAEPNFICLADVTPNDEKFAQQWNMDNTADHDLNAPEAWDVERGDQAIRIGIFDTGIDYLHVDLGEGFGQWHKVAGGQNYIDPEALPMDDFFHGTMVAGLAGALTNNGEYGMAGVAGGWGPSGIGCGEFRGHIT